MTEAIYLLTLCLPLATILVVFGMRYFSVLQTARARLANEGAYRDIASRSAAAQADTLLALSAIDLALADARNRLTAIEHVLKQVE